MTRRGYHPFRINPYSDDSSIGMWKAFWDRIKHIPNEHIVCIDETALCHHACKIFVYAPKGIPLRNFYLPRKEKRSLVVAIDEQKVLYSCCLPTSFSSTSFSVFFHDLLAHKLQKHHTTIIMDNIAFHKSTAIRQMAQRYGKQIIYTPPYSPFCNPIEEVFSILKRIFQKLFLYSFEERVQKAMDYIYRYSPMTPFYNHTRHILQNYLDQKTV